RFDARRRPAGLGTVFLRAGLPEVVPEMALERDLAAERDVRAEPAVQRPALRVLALDAGGAALELAVAGPVLDARADEEVEARADVRKVVGADPDVPGRLRILELLGRRGRVRAGLVGLTGRTDPARDRERPVLGEQPLELEPATPLGVIV